MCNRSFEGSNGLWLRRFPRFRRAFFAGREETIEIGSFSLMEPLRGRCALKHGLKCERGDAGNGGYWQIRRCFPKRAHIDQTDGLIRRFSVKGLPRLPIDYPCLAPL